MTKEERIEKERLDWLFDWAARMNKKYKYPPKYDDFGQALCRTCYGPDWNKNPPNLPTEADIEVAERWYNGEIPEWCADYYEE